MKDKVIKDKDETLDTLSCGSLSVLQKKNGYRYSLDAYLLGAFVEEKPETHVLDIGSGSGVISILLAAMKGLYVTGVEIQEDMAEMSQRSVKMAGLEDRVSIHCCDIKGYRGPKVDAVVANPPYRPVSTGRINPDSDKAVARHELFLDLETLIGCSYAVLDQGGRLYIIYPAWRLPDLLCAMRAHKVEPKRIQCVHSYENKGAEICLVCGQKGGGKELVVQRPLFVYTKVDKYSSDMDCVFDRLCIPKSH